MLPHLSFWIKNACIFVIKKGHILSRDAGISRGRKKVTFGLMDLPKFQAAIAELLGFIPWEAKSISSLNEQAELLFRKVRGLQTFLQKLL